MKLKLIILLLLFGTLLRSQDVIKIDGLDCGLHGSAKQGNLAYNLNIYKNRYRFPAKEDFDTSCGLFDLLKSADANQFSPDKAVDLKAYVFNVKEGGIETCNCKAKEESDRDTHIEVGPDPDSSGPQNKLIVEITPRLRSIMADKGLDWSTESLRQTLKGHWIEIKGWLFYDAEHSDEAFANDPEDVYGRKNWRGTCWEIHPVTTLQILEEPVVHVPDSSIVNTEKDSLVQKTAAHKISDIAPGRTRPSDKNNPLKDESHSYLLLLVLLLIFIGLVVILLIKLFRQIK